MSSLRARIAARQTDRNA